MDNDGRATRQQQAEPGQRMPLRQPAAQRGWQREKRMSSLPGMGTDISSELSAWRDRALNATLAVAAVIGLPVVIVVCMQMAARSDERLPLLGYVGLYLVVALLAVWRPPDARFRAWPLIVVGHLTASLSMALGGLAGDGRVYLVAVPVCALVLIGTRAGVVSAVLVLLTFSGFALAAQPGWLDDWLLIPTSKTTLFSLQDYAEIEVVLDDNGEVSRLDWTVGGITYPMPRVGVPPTE